MVSCFIFTCESKPFVFCCFDCVACVAETLHGSFVEQSWVIGASDGDDVVDFYGECYSVFLLTDFAEGIFAEIPETEDAPCSAVASAVCAASSLVVLV